MKNLVNLREFRFILTILLLQSLLSSCWTPPDPPPASTGPEFMINSPAANSSVSGAVFFSAQPSDPNAVTSVNFKAGGKDLATDTTSADGFKTFVIPKDYPAGNLELQAVVTGKDGTTRSKTITVNNVPTPPSSVIVAANGAVLGTTETSGAVSTLTLPPGVGEGANVSFQSKTKEEIKASTGVDYDALGVTFLGAQTITSSATLNGPLGVSSGGFGPQVQPGQAVVNYMIAPDADGDGKGELVVVNSASVAPNGDVISDPVPQVQLEPTIQVKSLDGERSVSIRGRQATALNVSPGTLLTLEGSGFNSYSPLGNVAVFESSAGGKTVQVPFGVTQEQIKQKLRILIPMMPAGDAKLVLKSTTTGYVSNPINLSVSNMPALNKPADQIINETLTEIQLLISKTTTEGTPNTGTNTIAKIEDVKKSVKQLKNESNGEIQKFLQYMAITFQNLDLLGSKSSDAISSFQARGRCDGNNPQLEGGIINNYMTAGEVAFGTGFGLTTVTLAGTAATVAAVAAPVLIVAGLGLLAYGFYQNYSLKKECYQNEPQACLPSSGAGGSGGGSVSSTPNNLERATPPPTPTGMGSAPPPGGSFCGSSTPGASDGASTNALSRAGSTNTAFPFANLAGRYVVKVTTEGRAVPFAGISDASGYFYLPFVPEGKTFTATAIDRVTGQKRSIQGVGAASGKSVFKTFDFSPQNQAPIADAGANQSVTVGANVALNGAGSSDPESAAITYSWALTTKPAGSAAILANATAVNPSFTADVAGDYIATLSVSDGSLTATDTVSITTTQVGQNRPPVAKAGAARSLAVGATVTLDGSGSSDPDGNAITYAWSVTSKPDGSTAALSSSSVVKPTFIADKIGAYQISLKVSDGTLENTDTTTITATGSNQIAWDGGGDGKLWSDAKNWAGDVLPSSSDRVVIDVPGDITVTYARDTLSVTSIESKEKLVVSGGTLEVDLPSAIENLDLQGGTFGGVGNLSINNMTWSYGTLKGVPGTTTTINSSLAMTTSSHTLDTLQLVNKGTATTTGGSLYLTGNATFTNETGATLTANQTGNQTLFTYSSPIGTSRVINKGSMVFDPQPNTNGVRQGNIEVPFISPGTVNINSGRLILSGDDRSDALDNTLGAITISDGAILEMQRGTNTFAGALTGTGSASLDNNGGTTTFLAGSSYNLPVTKVSSGTLSFNTGSSLILPTVNLDYGTLNGSDNFKITNFNWKGGTLGGKTGSSTIATSSLTMTGSSHTLDARQLINKGNASLSGSSGFYLQTGATFINDTGAIFTDAQTGDHYLFTYSGNQTGLKVENKGILNFNPIADTNGRKIGSIYTVFVNTGTININTGILDFRTEEGTGATDTTLSGTVNIADTAISRFGNGLNSISGTITGTGISTLENAGGTTIFQTGSSLTTSNVRVESGKLTFNKGSSQTIPALTLSGGTLNGSDDFSITNFNWLGGTLSGSIGSSATVSSSLTMTGSSFTLETRQLINKGTGKLNSGTFYLQTGSVFTNDTTATFTDAQTGDHSLFTYSGNQTGLKVENKGTLNFSPAAGRNGSKLGYIYPVFVNTGTLNINSGILDFRVQDGTAATDTDLAGIVNVAEGAILRFSNGLNTLSGTITGSGTAKTEVVAGILSLANPTYTVPTTSLTGGTLIGTGTINGNLDNAATLEVAGASIGKLTVTGNYTQTSNGRMNVDIGGLTAGTQFDQFVVTGLATLAGSLQIQLVNSYIPNLNDGFQIVTQGSGSSTFTNVSGTAITSGRKFSTTYNATGVALQVVP